MKKYILPCFALIFSLPLNAAKVQEVRTAKKAVVIDIGKEGGATKGQKYCFFAEDGSKIVCGKVVKVRNKDSSVLISNKKKLLQITPGIKAELEGENGGVALAKNIAIRGLYLGGLTPFSIKKVNYLAPTTTATSIDTLWGGEAKSALSLIAFGGEVDLLSLGFAVGFKFRSIAGHEIEQDFIQGNITDYVLNKSEVSNFAFYGDYYFIRTDGVKSGLRIGSGLDVDFSTVTQKITKKSDADGVEEVDLHTATSKLMLMSLRLPVNYDLSFDGLGLNLGANLLIPLFGTAQLSYSTDDPNVAKYGTDGESLSQEDYSNALSHKKNSVGVEMVLGAYMSF